MAIERLVLSVKEAAESLGVSVGTVRTLTRNGELPSVRIMNRVGYYVADLRGWLERQTDPAARAAWLEARYPGLVVFEDGSVGTMWEVP